MGYTLMELVATYIVKNKPTEFFHEHACAMMTLWSALSFRATYLAGELLCSSNDMVQLSAILCQITKGDYSKLK